MPKILVIDDDEQMQFFLRGFNYLFIMKKD